jgi:hypothetical protein
MDAMERLVLWPAAPSHRCWPHCLLQARLAACHIQIPLLLTARGVYARIDLKFRIKRRCAPVINKMMIALPVTNLGHAHIAVV